MTTTTTATVIVAVTGVSGWVDRCWSEHPDSDSYWQRQRW